MKVLITITNDTKLKIKFEEYNRNIALMFDRNLSFSEKVKVVAAAERTKVEIEKLLQVLAPNMKINLYDEEIFKGINDVVIRNLLMNGIYPKNEFEKLIKSSKTAMSDELYGVFENYLTKIEKEQYLFIWNLGEADADAILSH